MKAYWTKTRPNGKPVEAGTFCRVIDLEDGTAPNFVYGATQDEVWEKIERQHANAQTALQRAKEAQQRAAAPQTPPRREVSADEVMRATEDLKNPGKSGAAITTLIEAATGVDIRQLAAKEFATRAMEWEREHPQFFRHPGNRDMLGRHARSLAGGSADATTKEHLTRAFEELTARGMLFQGDNSPQNPNPTPSEFPAENPVQHERPRGTRFSTGAGGARLSPVPIAPGNSRRFVPKYTKEQLDTMPLSRSEELTRSDDKDYADACDFWYGDSQARA